MSTRSMFTIRHYDKVADVLHEYYVDTNYSADLLMNDLVTRFGDMFTRDNDNFNPKLFRKVVMYVPEDSSG